jgi:hypothetical protein
MSVISNGSLHLRLHYRVCRNNLAANASLFFCVCPSMVDLWVTEDKWQCTVAEQMRQGAQATLATSVASRKDRPAHIRLGPNRNNIAASAFPPAALCLCPFFALLLLLR